VRSPLVVMIVLLLAPGAGVDGPVRTLELPGGVAIRARLLDFVDSAREPPGKAFRATVVDAVFVEGRMVIRKGAGLLVHLTAAADSGQTLDLVGVNLGRGEWASVQALSPAAVLSETGLVIDARTNADRGAPLEPIVLQGTRVFVPSLTVVKFTLRTPVRLVVASPRQRVAASSWVSPFSSGGVELVAWLHSMASLGSTA
jgi:hypothetical protein